MGITEKMEHEMSLWATELDAPNKRLRTTMAKGSGIWWSGRWSGKV